MIDPRRPDYGNDPASPRRAAFGYTPADRGATPHVSIVTPFHQTRESFHDTARSVFAQSLQQWEWLIVNDGTTDPASLAVLDRYRDCDPRVRVIDLPLNAGPGAARNAGYAAARADLVLQLDSDNLLEPTAAEKWAWFLESRPDVAFVKGWSVGFGAETYLWTQGFHDGERFLERNLVDATSMVRVSAHRAADGYDESIRDGFEDWDFWLRCAAAGRWGATVPEYLDWYRRRANHGERWADWDGGEREAMFRAGVRRRFHALRGSAFPRLDSGWPKPNEDVPDDLPFHNRLRKDRPRILLLLPWLEMGGADKFNLDLIDGLQVGGWDVSVATTLKGSHPWLPEYTSRTPDVFILENFLRLRDYPRFLKYLIRSRDVDAVLITHSELGYLLLPYLRAHCQNAAFLDYCHIEEHEWRNGGYPRMAVSYQELLDANVVSSAHLKRWMVERGAEPDRIRVCHTNVDAGRWRPDPEARLRVRAELRIADDVPLILYAARLCDQKQPAVFAESIRRVRAAGLAFHAVVAGDGPDALTLRDALARGGAADRVTLAGSVTNDRVRELMAAADIFFLPSKWEGISLAIYEAMACGLVVVSADVGGQSEVVSPGCGVLVPRDTPDGEAAAYAAALAHLIQDGRLRREIGAAARERVVNCFPLDRMQGAMIDHVRGAIDAHRCDPRPATAEGLARTLAAQAIECVRLHHLSDWLWSRPATNGAAARTYSRISRPLAPIYRYLVDRGWTWLTSLRARVRLAVLGRR